MQAFFYLADALFRLARDGHREAAGAALKTLTAGLPRELWRVVFARCPVNLRVDAFVRYVVYEGWGPNMVYKIATDPPSHPHPTTHREAITDANLSLFDSSLCSFPATELVLVHEVR